MTYSKEQMAAKISQVAGKLGVEGAWLDAVINFETGGTYSPQVRNRRSSALGLIQLTDTAAANLFNGATSAEVIALHSDFMDQMDNVVYPYLEQYAPFANESELWLAIFYPAWRRKPLDTVLPDNVREVNPGIDTLGDYVDNVKKRVKAGSLTINPTAAVSVGLPGIAILGLFLWRMLKR